MVDGGSSNTGMVRDDVVLNILRYWELGISQEVGTMATQELKRLPVSPSRD